MKVHTNIQIINNKMGNPAFAVIPYREYLSLIDKKEATIPHDVVGLVIKMAGIS